MFSICCIDSARSGGVAGGSMVSTRYTIIGRRPSAVPGDAGDGRHSGTCTCCVCKGVFMHGTMPAIPRQSNPRRPRSRPKNSDPQPLAFGDLARFAYPFKTIEALGALTDQTTGHRAGRSTIKDWLNGSHYPPSPVFAAVVAEIMRRLAVRS